MTAKATHIISGSWRRVFMLALALLALAVPALQQGARAQMGDMTGMSGMSGHSMLLTPLGHKRAPLDFTLKDVMTGKPVRLSSLRGKVVVVNFWSLACPACRAELPTLQKLWHKLKGMDVEVLAVHIGGDAAKVRAFMQKNDIKVPVLHDEGENVAKAWGVAHMPVTYVLDTEGKLAFIAYGARNWQNPQLMRMLLTLVSPLHGNE